MKPINFSIGLIAILIVIVQILTFTYNEENFTKYLIKHNYLDSLYFAPDSVIKFSDLNSIRNQSSYIQLNKINGVYSSAKSSFDKRTEFFLKATKAFTLSTNLLYVLACFLIIIKGVILVKKHKKKVIGEQFKNIDNLITILLRIFQIDSESRVTIFIKDPDDENKIKILYRKYIQRETPEYNKNLRFSDNEGLPGRAKANPFIVGQEPSQEDLWNKTFISNIPGYIFEEDNFEENIKAYYRDTFNINEEKFGELSDLKYEIKSYFAAGIMCEELKKVLVLSIDSKKENAFYDFEVFNTLISRQEITQYIYERKDISLTKMLKELLPRDLEDDDPNEGLDFFDVRHEMTSFKVDPLLVYSMLKYILDLMHRSIFKMASNDTD